MNISDIAKLAGVSPATVSRYLNNGYLSEEKRILIEKVITETGYKPSQQAQTLRTGKTKLIGIIIPKIDSDSISQYVSGVSEVLTKDGYHLLLANTENNSNKEIEYIETFKEANVEGIIYLGTIKTPKLSKIIKNLSIPMVILGQKADNASCIYHDDYNASFDLAKYALSKGHKKLCFIGATDKDIAVGQMRKKGFIDALTSAGISVSDNMLYSGSFNTDNGYKNTERILAEHPDTTAILCATDTIALGAIKCLHEKKIDIPKQIAIAGFGDSKASSVLNPTLTTVHFYYKECGIEGAKMLLDIIANNEMPIKFLKLNYKVIKNDSL